MPCDFDFTRLSDCEEWTRMLIGNLRAEHARSGRVEAGALVFARLDRRGRHVALPIVVGLSPTTSLRDADERALFGAAIRRAIASFDAVGVLTVGEFALAQDGFQCLSVVCSLEHKAGSVLFTLPYVEGADGWSLGELREERVLTGIGSLAGFFTKPMEA